MKKTIAALIIAFMVVSLLVGCATQVTGQTTDYTGIDNVPATLTAEAGNTIRFILDANETTGYTWVVSIADESVVKLVSNEYFPTETDANVVGSGGTATITLSALKAGSTDVTLTYKRDWEGGETDTEKVVSVIVK